MKKLVLFLLLASLSCMLFATTLAEAAPGLTEAELQSLRDGKALKESTVDGDVSSLIPENAAAKAKFEAALKVSKGFTVAQASLVPYPEAWKTLEGEELEKVIYNTVLKISTMKGLIYISHRAGDKPKTLFEESSMLASSDKKDKIPDPSVEVVPPEAHYYVYQKDTTFGGNVYSLDYKASDDGLFMDITNETGLSFMGVDLVAKGKVSMSMTLVPVEEGIYVYSMATIKDKKPKVNLLVYSVDLEDCFFRRIEALKNWFSGAIGE